MNSSNLINILSEEISNNINEYYNNKTNIEIIKKPCKYTDFLKSRNELKNSTLNGNTTNKTSYNVNSNINASNKTSFNINSNNSVSLINDQDNYYLKKHLQKLRNLQMNKKITENSNKHNKNMNYISSSNDNHSNNNRIVKSHSVKKTSDNFKIYDYNKTNNNNYYNDYSPQCSPIKRNNSQPIQLLFNGFKFSQKKKTLNIKSSNSKGNCLNNSFSSEKTKNSNHNSLKKSINNNNNFNNIKHKNSLFKNKHSSNKQLKSRAFSSSLITENKFKRLDFLNENKNVQNKKLKQKLINKYNLDLVKKDLYLQPPPKKVYDDDNNDNDYFQNSKRINLYDLAKKYNYKNPKNVVKYPDDEDDSSQSSFTLPLYKTLKLERELIDDEMKKEKKIKKLYLEMEKKAKGKGNAKDSKEKENKSAGKSKDKNNKKNKNKDKNKKNNSNKQVITLSNNENINEENIYIEKLFKNMTKKITNTYHFSSLGICHKVNQQKEKNSILIKKNIMTKSSLSFINLCDGHGPFGEKVSKFISLKLFNYLHESFWLSQVDYIKPVIDNLKELFRQIFIIINGILISNETIDCTLSGSTLNSLIITDTNMLSINIGHSKSVIGKLSNITNCFYGEELSVEHFPDMPKEKERIIANKGRIIKCQNGSYKIMPIQDIGNSNNNNNSNCFQGIDTSRSFGDNFARNLGVISEPDFVRHEFEIDDKFIVMANFNFWKFISVNECCKIVGYFYRRNDIYNACNNLYDTIKKKWIKNKYFGDEIAFIVVFLEDVIKTVDYDDVDNQNGDNQNHNI